MNDKQLNNIKTAIEAEGFKMSAKNAQFDSIVLTFKNSTEIVELVIKKNIY